jgi:hypothetical protein
LLLGSVALQWLCDLNKLEVFESEVILGFGRVPLVGEDIYFEKNFYWLPFTPLCLPIPVLQY